jgi:CheY-like chemotaxis protein
MVHESQQTERTELTVAGSMGEELLTQAKHVARQITERVHQVLTEPAAAPTQSKEPVPLLRILCVDDNQDAADSLAAILELMGYEVRACYDGMSAMEVAQAFLPNVCFLDLNMPGMNGLELANQLKAGAGWHALLIAAVTALDATEYRTLTAVAGFHYHLVKPVNATTLRAALDSFRVILQRAVH